MQRQLRRRAAALHRILEMGMIIDTYAFPTKLDYYDYRDLIGSRLFTLYTRLGDTAYRIYCACYEPAQLRHDLTVIYAHGNGEALCHCHHMLMAKSEALGVRYVSFDWEGYGLSDGEATETSLKRSAEAVYRYVAAKYPASRIVMWGRSIGTVAACYLAAMHPRTSCCVLQSPMASAFNVVFKRACCACADGLENQFMIQSVRCPVVIIHGSADEIVPYKNALLIYDNYKRANGDTADVSELKSAEQVVEGVFDKISRKAYAKIVLYTIKNGKHNNLDSTFKAQTRWIAEQLIDALELQLQNARQ